MNGSTRFTFNNRHFSSREKAEAALKKSGMKYAEDPIYREILVGGRWVKG